MRTNTRTRQDRGRSGGKVTNTGEHGGLQPDDQRGASIERTSSDASTVGYDKSTNDASIGGPPAKRPLPAATERLRPARAPGRPGQRRPRRRRRRRPTQVRQGRERQGKTGRALSQLRSGDKTADSLHSRSRTASTRAASRSIRTDSVSLRTASKTKTTGGGVKINRDGVTIGRQLRQRTALGQRDPGQGQGPRSRRWAKATTRHRSLHQHPRRRKQEAVPKE